MGGEFFTDFKSSNGIEISRLVQVLLNFDWFRGSPPGGWWMDGWGWGSVWVCGGCPMHTRMHMHAHACTHVCTCMLNMLNMDASMLAAICNFIHVCVCVCMHAHAWACMWGHPHAPRYPQMPPTHLPPSQSRREPKTPNFNNSWTNRDNSILFEDSLPLDIPGLM